MKIFAHAILATPIVAVLGLAQQTVPFDATYKIPIAPHGLANLPLPKMPIVYATAEGQKIRVVEVPRALEFPFSLAFLPDGGILVTERAGRLRIIRDGKLD